MIKLLFILFPASCRYLVSQVLVLLGLIISAEIAQRTEYSHFLRMTEAPLRLPGEVVILHHCNVNAGLLEASMAVSAIQIASIPYYVLHMNAPGALDWEQEDVVNWRQVHALLGVHCSEPHTHSE